MCQSRALAYRFEPHGQVRDKAVTRFATRIRRCDGWLHEVAEIKPKPFRERWRSCRSRRLHDLRRCTFTERVTRRGTTCYERERESSHTEAAVETTDDLRRVQESVAYECDWNWLMPSVTDAHSALLLAYQPSCTVLRIVNYER